VTVFAAACRHGTVIAAFTVHSAVFVAKRLKFFFAFLPVNFFAFFVITARAANTFAVKTNAGAGAGHGAFFAVLHFSYSSFL
jgi:hypothetical protein